MQIQLSEEDFRVIIRCMYIARSALDDETNGVKSAPIQEIEATYHRLGEAFNAANAEAQGAPDDAEVPHQTV